jgi:starch phosphorylase
MLQNSLVNIDMEKKYKDALTEIGFKLEDIYDEEVDPALGNGGLGRLAACFLDSMATLDIPAMGYGIRYDYGIFKQEIKDGHQIEMPDYWLAKGNPWEIERADVSYLVRFGGYVTKPTGNSANPATWDGGEVVKAIAYDTPVPGFNTYNTNRLRLWRSKPSNEFDFQKFNDGMYDKSIMERQRAEYITSVLYPNDSTYEGKELRLKQQYFFCSATIQDIIKRFKLNNSNWNDFSKLNQIQLNDTHPAIAAIELLRVLLDVERLPFDQAWTIVTGTFAYTNHTVLPEALEKWSVNMLHSLLPRHMDLIFFINHIFLEDVKRRYPGNGRKCEVLSMIEGWEDKRVRMANVAIVCSHHVNGVAALHTEILKASVFKDFFELFPHKFLNMTNGVTPRRWLYCCNPGLSKLISETIDNEDDWVTDMRMIEEVAASASDPHFQSRFVQVKTDCKR